MVTPTHSQTQTVKRMPGDSSMEYSKEDILEAVCMGDMSETHLSTSTP